MDDLQVFPTSMSALWQFINCRTSPPAMTLVASVKNFHDAHAAHGRPSSGPWGEREKSPTRTLALPNRVLAVPRPRRQVGSVDDVVVQERGGG